MKIDSAGTKVKQRLQDIRLFEVSFTSIENKDTIHKTSKLLLEEGTKIKGLNGRIIPILKKSK